MMDEKTKRKVTISGTKLSVNNTQLLISSGIPSFDDIVGGGIPVGTIALIEEDTCSIYSKLMIQYFLAEGVVCGHSAFISSQEINSSNLVSCLPAVITNDEQDLQKSQSNTDELKIAWRYKNVPTNQNKSLKQFGHYYDLSKVMDSALTDKADIKCWSYCGAASQFAHTFTNPIYYELLEAIKTKINEGGFYLKSNHVTKSVLRIVIQSAGSPLWISDESITNFNTSQKRDLNLFIFCLRALIRSALATVLITIPSKIIDEEIVKKCIHSSDIVVRLESFTGTSLEKNSALADYQGFFHIVKLPAINTLAPKDLGPVDFAFKLRRKKFTIEELHLPPELQESSEREQDEMPSMGCGSANKYLLEF